jgi:hypothetical protein
MDVRKLYDVIFSGDSYCNLRESVSNAKVRQLLSVINVVQAPEIYATPPH